jgi:hypothetical protein
MTKLALKDYVHRLSDTKTTERSLFIKRIAEECAVTESTVYRWINQKAKPSPLAKRKLSELTNIPVTELFS